MTLEEMYHSGLTINDLLAMGLEPKHFMINGAKGGRPLLPLKDFHRMYHVQKQWLEDSLQVYTNAPSSGTTALPAGCRSKLNKTFANFGQMNTSALCRSGLLCTGLSHYRRLYRNKY
jgi:hypothetical protein